MIGFVWLFSKAAEMHLHFRGFLRSRANIIKVNEHDMNKRCAKQPRLQGISVKNGKQLPDFAVLCE